MARTRKVPRRFFFYEHTGNSSPSFLYVSHSRSAGVHAIHLNLSLPQIPIEFFLRLDLSTHTVHEPNYLQRVVPSKYDTTQKVHMLVDINTYVLRRP
jgi:hypothetical protein